MTALADEAIAYAGDERLADRTAFGIKAAGLQELPAEWTPNFFAISAAAANGLSQRKLKQLVAAGIAQLGPSEDGLMVRSSGVVEAIDDRGRFDSASCEAAPAEATATIETLRMSCSKSARDDLAFVVQRRVLSLAQGHLSNERRVSSDPRSWLCEAELPVADDQRSFRFRTDSETRSSGGLTCTEVSRLSPALRWAAKNVGADERERAHLEWVWDGARIWIVQKDRDTTPDGARPGAAWSAPNDTVTEPQVRLFRPACQMKSSTFPKVRNVATLASAQLPYGDVYVLHGARVIQSLAAGRVSSKLSSDLKSLIEAPVVVRTDFATGSGRPILMQKRTDTCRAIDQLVAFLVAAAREHVDSGGTPGALAFLAHRFLPARAGVFARARPGQSRVQVDSTWGLPDSLFYYPHDTFFVDTDSGSVDRHLRCKVDFIDVDETGQWKPRRAGKPWDWKPSLGADLAAEIAGVSSQLADYCDSELEVMFFAGVDDDGKEWSLPWFFAEVEHPNQTPLQAARGFYVGDRRRITNRSDIRDLETMLSSGPQPKIIITLRPEVGLLRDRDFVSEVATLATKFDLPIELEGSVLSHVYYLLDQAGATVRAVDAQLKREPRRAFGKLVRDLVPVRIERRGELADVYHPAATELLPIVRAKLVEEALEHYWAATPQEAREELADLLEIVRTAARVQGFDFDDVEAAASRKRDKRGGFDAGVVLIETRDANDVAEHRSLLDESPRGDRLRVAPRRPVRLPSRRMTIPLIPPDDWEQGTAYVQVLDSTDEVAITYGKDEVLIEVRSRATRPDASQLCLDVGA